MEYEGATLSDFKKKKNCTIEYDRMMYKVDGMCQASLGATKNQDLLNQLFQVAYKKMFQMHKDANEQMIEDRRKIVVFCKQRLCKVFCSAINFGVWNKMLKYLELKVIAQRMSVLKYFKPRRMQFLLLEMLKEM